MYKKVALLLLSAGVLYAKNSDYLSLSYEFLDFKNSKQKNVGRRYTLHLQKQIQNSTIAVAYEKTDTKTYQPPLDDNLRVDKVYMKIEQQFLEKNSLRFGYIYIDDNIVATDGTRIYSLGYTRKLAKGVALGALFYYGDFRVLRTYQYTTKVKYKLKYDDFMFALMAVGNYIDLDKCSDSMCKNAKKSYTFTLIKSQFTYKEYFLHMGFTIGKRAFSVMQDGFSCSHHAMEFDTTYMIGVGKHFDDVTVKLRYSYQKATELPIQNTNVKVENLMLRLQYSF